MWFLPTPQNPLKETSTAFSYELRCELIERAIQSDDRYRLCNIESLLPSPHYTLETITAMQEDVYKRQGEGLTIEHVSGRDFPEDLTPYDLVIHCGACMFNRRMLVARQDLATAQQVPMTNYGLAIAYLTGILDKVTLP